MPYVYAMYERTNGATWFLFIYKKPFIYELVMLYKYAYANKSPYSQITGIDGQRQNNAFNNGKHYTVGQYFKNKFFKCLKHQTNYVREGWTEIKACGGRRNLYIDNEMNKLLHRKTK
jgi:hypothetical protein